MKEYVVEMDSLANIVDVKLITESAPVEKQSKLIKEDQKLLNKLVPFDLTKYGTSYITENPDVMYFTFGRMSYFVVKDRAGNRYGEFRFAMPAKPAPIDLNLWAYMIRKMSEQ